MISELEKRVQRYWTQRSHDFGTVRRNELEDEMAGSGSGNWKSTYRKTEN